MKQIILEGQLGKEFGEEWNLNVNSPAEALQAIMTQRPGMRKFLIDSEGIQGYEVFIDDEPLDIQEELLIHNPGEGRYTFVPVIGGSKSSTLMMILGVTLVVMTGGFGAAGMSTFMGQTMATNAAGAAVGMGTAGATATTFGTAMSYLGTGLMLGGAAMMLAPDVPDGNQSEKAENYLFSGPVNTVKQGEPIPLVYGRAIVGSKTISASVFTNTSRQKLTAGRKMVGIPNFRTDGSKSGQGSITTSTPNDWGVYGRGMGGVYF
tara:strand:- start:1247 stop:2035 length:789 start_codon:yes stop_codon:yes gene_type:complete